MLPGCCVVIVLLCWLRCCWGQAPAALSLASTAWWSVSASVNQTQGASALLQLVNGSRGEAVLSWSDSQAAFALLPASAAAAPLLSSASSSLLFSNSSALQAALPASWLTQASVLLLFNLAAPCAFPACSLLSTAGNGSGAVVLSAAPSAVSSGQFVLQLTVLTQLSSVTLQSSLSLPFGSWQLAAFTVPAPLVNGSLLLLRTTAGADVLSLGLAPGDSLPAPPPSAQLNLTIADPALRGSVRDVVVLSSPLRNSSAADALFTFFYSLYGLSFPPERLQPPELSLLNSSVALLRWQPAFSPSSAVIWYAVRVQASAALPEAESFLPTYSTLTEYQYTLHGNSTQYAFAVYAANLDFPLPPVSSPLLYSQPVTAGSGGLPANASSSPLILQPPPPTLAPQIQFVLGSNVTLFLSLSGGAACQTAAGNASLCPLQALSVFFSTDAGANWTFFPFPVFSSASLSGPSLQATLPQLQPGQAYVFKSQASNVAGGQNSSLSASWSLVAPPASSSAAPQPPAPNASAAATAGSGDGSAAASGGSSALSAGSSAGNAASSSAEAASAAAPSSGSSQLPAPPGTLAPWTSSTQPTAASSPTAAAATAGSSGQASSASSTGLQTLALTSSALPTAASSLSAAPPSPPSLPSLSSGAWVGAAVSSSGSGSAPSLLSAASPSQTVIAAVIVGVFVGVVLLCALAYCCFCRRRQTDSGSKDSRPAQPPVRAAAALPSFAPSAVHDVELERIEDDWQTEEEGQHQRQRRGQAAH